MEIASGKPGEPRKYGFRKNLDLEPGLKDFTPFDEKEAIEFGYHTDLSDQITTILEKARLSERPSESSFVDLYERDAVTQDLLLLKKFELMSEGDTEEAKAARKRAEGMEAIFSYWGELGNWFGEDSMVTRTSEYDDRINGIDFIVEGQEVGSPTIRLGVDVTTSTQEDVLTRKLKKKVRAISEKRNKTKYFESQVDDERGEVFYIPAIISLSRKEIDTLIATTSMIFQVGDLRKNGKIDGNPAWYHQKYMEYNPFILIALVQIDAQLGLYIDKIKNHASNNEIIRAQNFIQGLIRDRSYQRDQYSTLRFSEDSGNRQLLHTVMALREN